MQVLSLCATRFEAIHRFTGMRFPKFIAIKFGFQRLVCQCRLFHLNQLLLELNIRELRFLNLTDQGRDKGLKLRIARRLRTARKSLDLGCKVERGIGVTQAMTDRVRVVVEEFKKVEQDVLQKKREAGAGCISPELRATVERVVAKK